MDTHADRHTAAVVNEHGRLLGCAEFPATVAGYHQLEAWAAGFGRLDRVGVEGTGSYGVGLARWLTGRQIAVVEVNRPNRAERRRRGKSDPIDAEQAARAVLAGTATAVPKARSGAVEVIRMVHATRRSALKARTAAVSSFTQLMLTSPDEVRETLQAMTKARQLRHAAALTDVDRDDPGSAARRCLQRLAVRIAQLTAEITAAYRELDRLTRQAAPALRDQPGFGPESTAQLLITVGDNPERVGSEAALAALCGTSPVPASSGRTHYYRLNRGGDRQANRALHMVILNRCRYHDPTRAYLTRHSPDGKATPHLRRVLKRYLIRAIYPLLVPPPDQP